MSWGLWLAMAIAIVLGVLWIAKPNLGRIGVGYARSRPKQAALVIAGLMVATTVIAAAGIAADSAGRSYSQSLLGTIHVTDVVIDGGHLGPAFAADRADVEALVNHAAFEGATALASGYAARYGVETTSGHGDNQYPFLGIDPASWSQIAKWEGKEGVVPMSLDAWASGAVLNEKAARELGLEPGDSLYLLFGGETFLKPSNTTLDGHFTVYVDNAAQPIIVDQPDDVRSFTWRTTQPWPVGGLWFRVEGDPATSFGLTVAAPGGEVYESPRAMGGSTVLIDTADHEFGPGAEFTIDVTSNQAIDQDFTVTITEMIQAVADAEAIEIPIIGVVGQFGANPLDSGGTVFLPLHQMHDLFQTEDVVNVAIVDFAEGTDLSGRDEALTQAAQQAWPLGGIQVRNVRAEVDEGVAYLENSVRYTFLGIGSFSIIAGFMLIGVMMALLVEERKGTLAATRALGAQRGHVTQMLLHEGSVYSALAGVAGLVGALVLAVYLSGPLSIIFESDGGRFSLVFKPITALAAAGMGFFLTLAVIAFAAHRAGRFHIAAALRGAEEEPRAGRWARRIVQALLLGLGLLLSIIGFAGSNAMAQVLGPVLVALGVAALSGNRSGAYAVIGTLITVYLLGSFWFIEPNDEREFLLFPLRAVLLAVSLGIVVAYSAWLHGLIVRATSRARRAAPFIETALGHIRRRPGRAALTVAMFSTVLIVLTALGTLFATFAPNDMGSAGGYDIVGDSRIDLGDPEAFLAENPSISGVDPFASVDRWIATPMVEDMANYIAYQIDETRSQNIQSTSRLEQAEHGIGVTPEFIDQTSFKAETVSGVSGARGALQAVLDDPTNIVLSDNMYLYLNEERHAVKLGDTFELRGVGEVRVVGMLENTRVAGVFAHPAALAALQEARNDAVGTRIWVETGAAHQKVIDELEAGFRRAGLEATSRTNVDPEEQATGSAFQTMIGIFLGLGIMIGMVSLALIMGRNVMIRRAEVGTFRAIGAGPRDILVMFTLEALYLALFSIAIGLGVGLLLAKSMVAIDALQIPLKVDWASLTLLYGFTLVAAALAALIPAWQASRLPVATAVRHSE